jgi:hypothetical protein
MGKSSAKPAQSLSQNRSNSLLWSKYAHDDVAKRKFLPPPRLSRKLVPTFGNFK